MIKFYQERFQGAQGDRVTAAAITEDMSPPAGAHRLTIRGYSITAGTGAAENEYAHTLAF